MPRHSNHQSSHASNPITKILSCEELSAIYDEIVDDWSRKKWLKFIDHHNETFLTLHTITSEWLSIQKAIDHYLLLTLDQQLRTLPECLLIRTKPTSSSTFQPNDKLSLHSLCHRSITQELFSYKLMSILCHSDDIDGKILFHQHFPTGSWYLYRNATISSPPSSYCLSPADQNQLNLFISSNHRLNPMDPIDFPSYPFSTLYNHPTVYIYIRDTNKSLF